MLKSLQERAAEVGAPRAAEVAARAAAAEWLAGREAELERRQQVLRAMEARLEEYRVTIAACDATPRVVNRQDRLGRTPAYMASDAGQVAALALLLEAGADLEIPDRDGRTCLQRGCFHGHAAVIDLILKQALPVPLLLEFRAAPQRFRTV
jgi:hypothetical protein